MKKVLGKNFYLKEKKIPLVKPPSLPRPRMPLGCFFYKGFFPNLAFFFFYGFNSKGGPLFFPPWFVETRNFFFPHLKLKIALRVKRKVFYMLPPRKNRQAPWEKPPPSFPPGGVFFFPPKRPFFLGKKNFGIGGVPLFKAFWAPLGGGKKKNFFGEKKFWKKKVPK